MGLNIDHRFISHDFKHNTKIKVHRKKRTTLKMWKLHCIVTSKKGLQISFPRAN